MRRFETLNVETQDMVNCFLPPLAQAFGVAEVVDIIPEDIRMRAWDCERRDHIKTETENDPRNWGVQFLKDLMAISRLNKGNLAEFQAELRAKIANHEDNHPWCRLADIKEIKLDYEHPERKNPPPEAAPESSDSSTDSYLEELVEPDLPKGMRRGRRDHEVYEARVQIPAKRRRLRRGEDGKYIRPEKRSKRDSSSRYSTPMDRGTPISGAGTSDYYYNNDQSHTQSARRPSRTILSDHEGDSPVPSHDGLAYLAHSVPLCSSTSPFPVSPTSIPLQLHSVDSSREPLEVQKLQAELEVAEAELKAARLKMAYIQAKEQAEKQKE